MSALTYGCEKNSKCNCVLEALAEERIRDQFKGDSPGADCCRNDPNILDYFSDGAELALDEAAETPRDDLASGRPTFLEKCHGRMTIVIGNGEPL
jgi:hypothetical protein